MKIKFGAIVTDGLGKIGGMQVRRLGATRILQLKNNPRKMNILLRNPVLPLLTKVFIEWGFISPADRAEWANQAVNYFVTDDFNDQRNYTARGLFVALNVAYYLAFRQWVDVYNLSSVLQGFVFNSVYYDIEFETFNLNVTNLGADWSGGVAFQQLANDAINPNPTTLPIVGYFDSVDLATENFWQMLALANGGLFVGGIYAIALFEINSSGFTSARQFIKFTLT